MQMADKLECERHKLAVCLFHDKSSPPNKYQVFVEDGASFSTVLIEEAADSTPLLAVELPGLESGTTCKRIPGALPGLELRTDLPPIRNASQDLSLWFRLPDGLVRSRDIEVTLTRRSDCAIRIAGSGRLLWEILLPGPLAARAEARILKRARCLLLRLGADREAAAPSAPAAHPLSTSGVLEARGQEKGSGYGGMTKNQHKKAKKRAKKQAAAASDEGVPGGEGGAAGGPELGADEADAEVQAGGKQTKSSKKKKKKKKKSAGGDAADGADPDEGTRENPPLGTEAAGADSARPDGTNAEAACATSGSAPGAEGAARPLKRNAEEDSIGDKRPEGDSGGAASRSSKREKEKGSGGSKGCDADSGSGDAPPRAEAEPAVTSTSSVVAEGTGLSAEGSVLQPLTGPVWRHSFSKHIERNKGEDKSFLEPGCQFLLGPPQDGCRRPAANFGVFGVFDGHGGRQASGHAAKTMLKLIMDAVDRMEEAPLPEPAPEDLAECGPRPEATWHAQDSLARRLPGAMSAAFRRCDEEILRRFKSSGTTATVAAVCGWEVIVAGVGDSLAFLDTGSQIVPLTTTHRIEDSPSERERLLAEGSEVQQAQFEGRADGPLRVWPSGLAMARSLGDADAGPAVSPEPDVWQVTVPNTGGRLVIASDGLWDTVNAKSAISQMRSKTAAEAVHRLQYLALSKKHSADDITVVIVDLLPTPADKLPPALACGRKSAQHAHGEQVVLWQPLKPGSAPHVKSWDRRRQAAAEAAAEREAAAEQARAEEEAVARAQEEAEAEGVRVEGTDADLEASGMSDTYRELINLRIDPAELQRLNLLSGDRAKERRRDRTPGLEGSMDVSSGSSAADAVGRTSNGAPRSRRQLFKQEEGGSARHRAGEDKGRPPGQNKREEGSSVVLSVPRRKPQGQAAPVAADHTGDETGRRPPNGRARGRGRGRVGDSAAPPPQQQLWSGPRPAADQELMHGDPASGGIGPAAGGADAWGENGTASKEMGRGRTGRVRSQRRPRAAQCPAENGPPLGAMQPSAGFSQEDPRRIAGPVKSAPLERGKGVEYGRAPPRGASADSTRGQRTGREHDTATKVPHDGGSAGAEAGSGGWGGQRGRGPRDGQVQRGRGRGPRMQGGQEWQQDSLALREEAGCQEQGPANAGGAHKKGAAKGPQQRHKRAGGGRKGEPPVIEVPVRRQRGKAAASQSAGLNLNSEGSNGALDPHYPGDSDAARPPCGSNQRSLSSSPVSRKSTMDPVVEIPKGVAQGAHLRHPGRGAITMSPEASTRLVQGGGADMTFSRSPPPPGFSWHAATFSPVGTPVGLHRRENSSRG